MVFVTNHAFMKVKNILLLIGRIISFILSISIGGTIVAEYISILIGRSSYQRNFVGLMTDLLLILVSFITVAITVRHTWAKTKAGTYIQGSIFAFWFFWMVFMLR